MIGPLLIPAAGRSVRMGRPKLLLPLGGRTIVERLIATARDGGIERIVVVVRPDEGALAAVAERAGAVVVRLADATDEMRQTVLAGLDWIEANVPPAERAAFYLLPADHPTLTPAVFRALAEADGSVVVPTHAGRRGHPAKIAWDRVAGLRAVPSGQGLNRYLRTQAVSELPWPTPDVLIDLDTPDDYERLKAADEAWPVRIDAGGNWRWRPESRPRVVIPGSFNPVHAGHWGLAGVARDLLGDAAAFELSRRNVDKPDLSDEEISRRATQFAGRAELWITTAPRFVDKARHFPGAVFVVGADTAARIVDTRYHDGEPSRLAEALDAVRDGGCRFLVAARAVADGAVATLDDLPIPPRWRGLFEAIPASRFRLDISSTQLRREGGET